MPIYCLYEFYKQLWLSADNLMGKEVQMLL